MAEKERIDKVMQIEGMNSAVFATAIGIQGSTLSHILNGRNNPSLSVLQSILNRFPNISSDWLIMGQGPVERSAKQSQTPTLFDSFDESTSKSDTLEHKYVEKSEPLPESIQQRTVNKTESPINSVPEQSHAPFIPQVEPNSKAVRKIIVYYTDNTFQEFETK